MSTERSEKGVRLVAAARQYHDGRLLAPGDIFFAKNESEAHDLCALAFARRAPVSALVTQPQSRPETVKAEEPIEAAVVQDEEIQEEAPPPEPSSDAALDEEEPEKRLVIRKRIITKKPRARKTGSYLRRDMRPTK